MRRSRNNGHWPSVSEYSMGIACVGTSALPETKGPGRKQRDRSGILRARQGGNAYSLQSRII